MSSENKIAGVIVRTDKKHNIAAAHTVDERGVWRDTIFSSETYPNGVRQVVGSFKEITSRAKRVAQGFGVPYTEIPHKPFNAKQ